MSTRRGPEVSPSSCECKETFQIPAAVDVALYRIAQEALANAARHCRARTVLGLELADRTYVSWLRRADRPASRCPELDRLATD